MKLQLRKWILLICLLCFAAPLSAEIVHHYNFDGNNADDLVGSANGSLNIASLQTNAFPGRPGLALGLAGGDSEYMEMGNATELLPEFGAISVWAYCTNYVRVSDPGRKEGYLINAGGSTGGDNRFYLWQKDEKFRFTYGPSSSSKDARAGTIPLGEWVHWTITWTNAMTRIYTNGVYLVSNQDTLSTPALYGKARVGRRWRGYIDEVKIYSNVLTSTEVSHEYSNDYKLQVLDQPASFASSLPGAGAVALSWNDISGETGYVIYRTTDNVWTTSSQVATVTSGKTAYTNTGLTVGTEYYFWIRATNATDQTMSPVSLLRATPNSGPVVPEDLAADGITHRYSFDSNNVKDLRGNIDGSLSGDAIYSNFTMSSFSGQSLYLPGGESDYADLGDATNILGGFGSFSAWSYCENYIRLSDPSRKEGFVVLAGGSSGGDNRFYIWQKDEKFRMTYGKSSSTIDAKGGTVPLNEWVKWTITWTNDKTSIYTNGVHLVDNIGTLTIPDLYGSLKIGKRWRGFIDEVTFFGRVLNDSEIMSNYQSDTNVSPVETNLTTSVSAEQKVEKNGVGEQIPEFINFAKGPMQVFLPEDLGQVSFKVINVNGRKVYDHFGEGVLTFEGKDYNGNYISNGLYQIIIYSNEEIIASRMLLIFK